MMQEFEPAKENIVFIYFKAFFLVSRIFHKKTSFQIAKHFKFDFTFGHFSAVPEFDLIPRRKTFQSRTHGGGCMISVNRNKFRNKQKNNG